VEIDPDVVAKALASDSHRADALLAILQSVEDGTLTADGPAAAAVVRRLEGALLALAAMGEPRSGEAQ
jgi:hypothetical protein